MIRLYFIALAPLLSLFIPSLVRLALHDARQRRARRDQSGKLSNRFHEGFRK